MTLLLCAAFTSTALGATVVCTAWIAAIVGWYYDA